MVLKTTQQTVIGAHISWSFAFCGPKKGRLYAARHGGYDPRGNLVLDVEYFLHRAIVAVGPNALFGIGTAKLHRYPQARPHAAHAALKAIIDTQMAPSLANLHGPAAIGMAGISRWHEQRTEPGKFGYQILGKSIGKIVLFGIARAIDERDDGDRRSAAHIGRWY